MAADDREVDLLAQDVGAWRADVEVRPAPGGPAQKSHGTLSCRMVGRWLVSDFKNETSGFEGHGIVGWDSVELQFVATWVDPMRRGLVVMRGEWDPEDRTMTFFGEMARPDGSRLRWREVTERPSEDGRVFRSLVQGPEGELEVTKVRYERQSR
jgi:hypothetical protein